MSSNKTLFGLIIIGILFFAIILSASIMGVFKGYEPYQQLIAAMLSVAATGVITALLLIFQRKQQEELTSKQQVFEKERLQETKVFEEKLRIYKVFLHKLCDVVKDQKITPEEEIELQFQVSYIAMHTSSKSINNISVQVKDIIERIKRNDPNKKIMLKELFEIADSFNEELYDNKNCDDDKNKNQESNDEDDIRGKTIENFEIIVYSDIKKYEKVIELKDRTRRLKKMINNDGYNIRIFSSTVLFHEFLTTINNGDYVESKDIIAVDLMPEEEQNRYVVLLCTRQYDIEKTKELTKGLWPNEEFNPWSKNPTRHVHEIISFYESDEVIKTKIEKVLQEVKAYRDKEYPLK